MFALKFFAASLWGLLLNYQRFMFVVRITSQILVVLRFLLFRAPLLIIWTRMPVLKDIKAPYGYMAEILGPERNRPPLLISEQGPRGIAEMKTKEEMMSYVSDMRRRAALPRPTHKVILGGVVRGLLIELGPVFIKLGEIAGMRPEVPPFLREELQLLQDSPLPFMDQKTVRQAIDREIEELGLKTDEIFEWIDLSPMATGSMSQVHKGKLKTGDEVVLKVQLRHLEAIASLDGKIVSSIINSIRLFPGTKNFDTAAFVTAFGQCLTVEQNFFLEGIHQTSIRQKIEQDPLYSKTVKVATVYTNYTTRKLLVMEMVKGFHRADRLTDVDPDKLWDLMSQKLSAWPEDYPAHMVRLPLSVWGDMVLCWGLLHSDPNLGNVSYLEPQDGYDWRVFICDFGMVMELPPLYQDFACDLVRAWLWHQDRYEVLRLFSKFIEPTGMLDDETNWGKDLTKHLDDMFHPEFIRENLWVTAGAEADDVMADLQPLMKQTVIPREKGQMPEMRFKHRGKVSALVAWIDLTLGLYRRAVPKGYRCTRIFTSFHIHWFKSILYLEEMSTTLYTPASMNDMFTHALKESVKKATFAQLDEMNVVNVRNYIKSSANECAHALQDPELFDSVPNAVSSAVKKKPCGR